MNNKQKLSTNYFVGLVQCKVNILGYNDDEEGEEKAKLINEVLELQNTLEDLSQRVDAVKDENLKLKSENQVLGQYIENLMSASSVFQATNAPTKKRQVPSRPT
ncbi:short coiled-coil A isoform X3, partial [Paramuricea clavata]